MVIKIIHSVKTRDAKICFVKGLMISCTYKIFHRPDLLFIINEAKKRRDLLKIKSFSRSPSTRQTVSSTEEGLEKGSSEVKRLRGGFSSCRELRLCSWPDPEPRQKTFPGLHPGLQPGQNQPESSTAIEQIWCSGVPGGFFYLSLTSKTQKPGRLLFCTFGFSHGFNDFF